jgi:hypothetical protein
LRVALGERNEARSAQAPATVTLELHEGLAPLRDQVGSQVERRAVA